MMSIATRAAPPITTPSNFSPRNVKYSSNFGRIVFGLKSVFVMGASLVLWYGIFLLEAINIQIII
jgi:hypothetical protein